MSEEVEDLNPSSENGEQLDYKRLWIGNLDSRINEYQLLKLMQKYGAIEKFDLLFHRTGPLAGQPRGYAFVTFVNKKDAIIAKTCLHNMNVGTKNIVVTWAHSMNGEEVEKPKPEINIPALGIAKPEKKTNREFQIHAIEAKLKLMERNACDELIINKTVATETPVISQFQHNKQQSSSATSIRCRNTIKKFDRSSKPYNRHKGRR